MFPAKTSLFSQGWNTRPEHLSEVIIDPGMGTAVLDNGIMAYDATQATAVLDHIGDRPVINCTNSGSTATDIVNAQCVAGAFQVLAGKQLLAKGSFRMTTTTQDLFLGLWAIDTNYWSTLPTDYIGIEKASASTQFVVRARKASGTAQVSQSIGPVLVADTWYDWAIRVVGDPSTAGQAIVQVAIGASVPAGGIIPVVFNGTFSSQIPDTVDLAPGFSWRAGSAANVSGYIGLTGFTLEA
jgi:hypothetical protein